MSYLGAAVLTALALGHPRAGAAQDFAAVEIRSVLVVDGLFMLTGRGGNIGVSIGDDGVFLIDDQFAPLSEKIVAAVAKLDPRPVRFVLNTHLHGDHTGGNENLAHAGAVIVAHDNVRKRMSVKQVDPGRNREVPPAPAVALPIVTFDHRISFHVNGDELRALHVPSAHTDGDSVVHFPAKNAIHAGDVFFNGIYPFIDVSSGGSIDGMLAAVDGVLELADERTKIIPGHGPLATREDLVAYRDMLRTVRERIGAAIAQGQSVEQVLGAALTAELDPVWGDGFLPAERFVRMVYADLSRARDPTTP